MSEINRVLGSAGAGLSVGGVTLAVPTKRMQAKFEEWVESRARKAVADFAGVVSDEQLAAMAERHAARVEAGEYDFGGEKCRAALLTYAGCLELLRLMMEPHSPGATADDAERLMLTHAAELKMVLRQAAGKPAEGGDDDSKKNAAAAA